MPNGRLLSTMLAVHFAKDSSRPLRGAIYRICAAYAFALVFGMLLSRSVARAELPVDVPLRVTAPIIMGFGYIFSGLLMLTMQANQQGAQRTLAFLRTTRLLPIAKPVRYITQIAPSLLVLGVLYAFGVQIILALAKSMQHPGWLLALTLAAGLLAGYGLLLMAWPRTALQKGFLFVAVVSTALWLLDWTLTSNSESAVQAGSYSMLALFSMSLVGLVHQYNFGYELPISEQASQLKPLIPGMLPYAAWFALKLWRNGRSRTAFFLAISLSLLTAISIVIRRKTFSDPYPALLFGAVLASTFACDVRGVLRRHLPPEMPLLHGLRSVVVAQVWTVLCIGLVVGLPVFFAVHSDASNSGHFLLFYVCIQLFASLGGLLASAVFVPAAGETGSQFFAAIMATGLLLGFPKAAGITGASPVSQAPYWLAAAACFSLFIYGIELIRRRSYGRT